MSWFSGKVNDLVRDAQRGISERAAAAVAEHHAGRLHGLAARSADELAAELEAQARRVAAPQAAIELLAKWAERSDAGQGAFPLGGVGEVGHGLSEPLSFGQALLRSQALETLLDACARHAALRAELLRGGPGGCAQALPAEGDPGGALAQALRAGAERLLLPGAHALWPGLLEVLLLSVGSEEQSGAAKGVPRGHTAEYSCASWARRALAVVKRSWQSEALPTALRCLDRKLVSLTEAAGAGDAAADASGLLRSAGGMSKTGIRAALAREKLKSHSAKAERLRQRTELLCDACARLEAAEGCGSKAIPEAEKLLSDADEMLAAMDEGVKELSAHQEALRQKLGEATAELEQQIALCRETTGSLTIKQGQLQDERALLMRRLEEVNMQLAQIDEVTAECEQRAKTLGDEMRDLRNRLEEEIASSFCRQRRLADEKQRAVTCKECAHTALDLVRAEERRRLRDVEVQLGRRRAELRRTCALYLKEERLRIEAAAELLGGRPPPPMPSPASPQRGAARTGATEEEDAAAVAGAAIHEAWRLAGAVLRRAEPLLMEAAEVVDARAAEAGAEGAAAAGGAGEEGGPGDPSGPAAEAAPEDALAFFARERAKGQVCVDCGDTDAKWASVSHGTYLCMECAGRHRGLGVHISFVRSTTLDMWSPEQLRRMQLGGTARFRQMLQGYPQLREPPRTPAALAALYGSRAAAHYRRVLDIRCAGGPDAELPPAPSAAEGHLPGDTAAPASGSGSGSGAAAAGTAGGARPWQSQPARRRSASGEDGDGEPSVEEEREALREAYFRHIGQGQQDPSQPG